MGLAASSKRTPLCRQDKQPMERQTAIRVRIGAQAVEFGDQRFGRNRSIGAIKNEGDFIPINFIANMKPTPERL